MKVAWRQHSRLSQSLSSWYGQRRRNWKLGLHCKATRRDQLTGFQAVLLVVVQPVDICQLLPASAVLWLQWGIQEVGGLSLARGKVMVQG